MTNQNRPDHDPDNKSDACKSDHQQDAHMNDDDLYKTIAWHPADLENVPIPASADTKSDARHTLAESGADATRHNADKAVEQPLPQQVQQQDAERTTVQPRTAYATQVQRTQQPGRNRPRRAAAGPKRKAGWSWKRGLSCFVTISAIGGGLILVVAVIVAIVDKVIHHLVIVELQEAKHLVVWEWHLVGLGLEHSDFTQLIVA